MIIFERISALAQENGTSHAIVSSRGRNQNPALEITLNNDGFRWEFTGLQLGEQQEVDEDNPRINHVDAYIGMDDLAANLDRFPETNSDPAGDYDGLRVPAGTEREGGTQIRWRGAITRSLVSDIDVNIPPVKMLKTDNDIILNVDRETSAYPIDNGNGRTTFEIHFGVEHDFEVRRDGRINVCRIGFTMNPEHYATVLAALENEVDYYTTHLQN
jgi:hypothetical protein